MVKAMFPSAVLVLILTKVPLVALLVVPPTTSLGGDGTCYNQVPFSGELLVVKAKIPLAVLVTADLPYSFLRDQLKMLDNILAFCDRSI